MVMNNCYTNYMLKKTLQYTLEVAREMKRDAPERWRALAGKLGIEDSELVLWKKMAQKMRISRDAKTGVFEQHDGFFDLPNVEARDIPPEEIPIYKNWPYEKIFRYNMIKQPDVLLLMLFFSRDFRPDEKLANYRYYEARCIHESSLSPSIHSILASELGIGGDQYEFFTYMARLDLDNYNRNTEQGLHTTAMSGAWLSMVYGFAGMRTDGKLLSFRPTIPRRPRKWTSYRFRLAWRGSVLEVEVDQKEARFRTAEGPQVEIEVYGRKRKVGAKGVALDIEAPATRRGSKGRKPGK
jgi:maltose phosphorylase